MEATFRINTDSITPEFLEGIKKLFPHKTVDITIQLSDETERILSNPVFTQVLQERITDYESTKQVISLKEDDLL